METITQNTFIQTKELQDAITPQMALSRLQEGNKRFRNDQMIPRDYRKQAEGTAKRQFPFAAVLGCIDSRVPAEIVFDQGIGDIFTVRIAGNFVNQDILGSLEFACKVAGAKAILVLGHSNCGAIQGACNKVELGNLTPMLEKLKPAVHAVERDKQAVNLSFDQFVQKVAETNVRLTIEAIKEESEVLREMCESGEVAIAGGMYHIETSHVNFIEG